ncbi:MAG TPA: Flp family type IVb pilin [Dehalococcoidia bacterium]|jgi:Flp pilus assembly pilin Flp|nr:Flp family type IVb pilin [Dehalococcoidia bacterium]
MLNHLRRFFSNESGQTYVELGLIMTIISIALIGLLMTVGGSVEDHYMDLQTKILNAL